VLRTTIDYAFRAAILLLALYGALIVAQAMGWVTGQPF
jgi:hypothetical protein